MRKRSGGHEKKKLVRNVGPRWLGVAEGSEYLNVQNPSNESGARFVRRGPGKCALIYVLVGEVERVLRRIRANNAVREGEAY
jgi:hypothetical protein